MDECLLARAASLVCEMLSAKRLRGVSESADFDVWRAHTYALAEVYGVHMDDKIVTLKVNVVECGVTTQ